MKYLQLAHAVLPTLHMFLNATEQTQLLNYLHHNINFSRNERLYALTAQQKCMLLGCSNTLHSTLWSSDVSQLEYGTLPPTNGKKYHMPLILAVICHKNEAQTAKTNMREGN